MRMQYVRTDRNGTKIYHDDTCQRCGGHGARSDWAYTGLTCYECGGTGHSKIRVIKEYTPEYRAKLDAQAEKRRAKKLEEKRSKQPEWKLDKGFVNDRIYVVSLKNSYDVREDIKNAGGKFQGWVWYFSEHHEEFQTVEMTADECLTENGWGGLEWRIDIKDQLKEKLPKDPESDYIGNIGDKLDLDVTHEGTAWFDTRFGTTYVHRFRDAAGNVLVWKTSSCGSIEKCQHIKGTVKEHNEYNGQKQTILTRCKIA